MIDDGSRGEADSEVDVAFAIDDGKGFEMLEAWREALVGFCTRT